MKIPDLEICPVVVSVDEVMNVPPGRPEWLHGLLTAKFFTGCQRHAVSKKNERNIYCVDCTDCVCQHCMDSHSRHRLLQIRRYVYHDVVRLQDITKLVDCCGVQTYIINSAKVVFLNQRPQPRPTKGCNSCETCERTLQGEYRYCSLCCKVDAVMKSESGIGHILHRCTSLPSLEVRMPSPICIKRSSSEVEMMETEGATSGSSLENPESTSSGISNGNDEGVYYTSSTNFFVAPKKSRTIRFVTQPYPKQELSPRNRRKGTPQRSPAF